MIASVLLGNILGALLGEEEIPAGWLEKLELQAEIGELAEDLLTCYREDDEWFKKYPGW